MTSSSLLLMSPGHEEKDDKYFTLMSPHLSVEPTADSTNKSQISSSPNLEILNVVLQEAIAN